MKTILFAGAFIIISFITTANAPEPFIFVSAQGGQFENNSLICKGNIHLIWSYNRNYDFTPYDRESAEFIVEFCSLFDEVLKSITTKDTLLFLNEADLNPSEGAFVVKLVIHLRNNKTKTVDKLESSTLLKRKSVNLDNTPHRDLPEDFYKLMNEYLRLGCFLNARGYYYGHPESHTPDYDVFFRNLHDAIVNGHRYKIKITETFPVLEISKRPWRVGAVN